MPTSTEWAKPSYWQTCAEVPGFAPLTHDLQVDVCVVGAGIAGLSTAYQLLNAKKSVAIVDDGPIAHGMSIRTSAHLTNVIDDTFVSIERWHGPDGARRAAESHGAAIDTIEHTIQHLGIDCGFRRLDGYLFCAPGDDRSMLEKELAAVHRAGVAGEIVATTPMEPHLPGPAIRYPRQARFHPARYYAGLVQAIASLGGQFFCNSHVDRIEGGEEARVNVGDATVRAGAVVVATNSPINDMFAIHTKQAPYTTYVIGAMTKRGSLHDALYWDTQENYHYVRLQQLDDEHDLVIIGGEDHKAGQADDTNERHGRLEAWARKLMPQLGLVAYRWAGQCMETIDGLAFIGRNPGDHDNVYIATGDSGMGLTHGTIAGLLLKDLICGRENPWATLYDPARKTINAARTYLAENLNVAWQYADWVSPAEVKSTNEIPLGGGAVVREGTSLIAASRGGDGKLTCRSAVCPHLGCIVHWNDAEKTWDCPCHGSRFQASGDVVNGPANVPLAARDSYGQWL